jgi:hypothetical protein
MSFPPRRILAASSAPCAEAASHKSKKNILFQQASAEISFIPAPFAAGKAENKVDSLGKKRFLL